MGYTWHPIIRTVPLNGAEETFDLTTALTECGEIGRASCRERV